MSDLAAVRRPIRRLDPSVVERIAAGEVVEQPASVVKELIENAVDAGAASVTIRLEDGGLDRIEVSDDGTGIPPDEVALAVERHATNKLEPTGPIERIDSLGFRGEALASIATVSRFRLLSRPPDREEAKGISVTGGTVGKPFVAPRSVGTTVEVRDLFFRTPARRKFLKSPAAEQVAIVQTVERLYLARPTVGLRVESEGKEIANYPTSPTLLDAAARVLGPELLHAFFEVDAGIPGGRVRGVLGRPALSAPTSRRLFVSVNGRSIESRPIAVAVRLAFGDVLPRTRYPVGVVHLTIESDCVDVNVHPTKREVRFVRERELTDALRDRVREALLVQPQVADVGELERPVRSRPPSHDRGRLAPESLAVVRGAPGVQRTLETHPTEPTARSVKAVAGHPALTLLGCLEALYWVATAEGDLLLIDQHAASERVVYDTLRRNGTLARQTLVDPLTIRLTGAQRTALTAHGETVRAAGFDVEPFGPEDVRVRAIPTYRGGRARPEALHALLDELADGGRPTIPDGPAERTTATIACHAAIRAGDVVGEEEFARVLEALYALPDAAYACPHGRPIVVRIPRGRLDRWFLRSGG